MNTLEKIAGLNAYTYLPDGYEAGGRYPLILFFPGLGEDGTNASLLLRNGPNKFITEGWRPQAIVISVQPTYGWVPEAVIDKVLTEIFAKYRVNPYSVHLTGLSAGGWAISQYALNPAYASRITTVVPMSAPEVSTHYKFIPETAGKVKWWGFCGDKDSHYARMVELTNKLNAAAPGTAKLTVGSYGHCCWNDNYKPSVGIYDWMLAQGGSTTQPEPEPEEPARKLITTIKIYDNGDVEKV